MAMEEIEGLEGSKVIEEILLTISYLYNYTEL